ncbi:hydroxymethylbilane synthase [Saccharopolyspora antimicrobica]|uniref:Porphobilinogen deaminase n=2 Tax=Saccharopolyspora TaxID=1835 RepID=A0A1I4QHD4_9PSEU|nr:MULTISPECIES: hydroxymethylbilane synthase [Saccharopolyspora]RKT84933.1 hydroxymethylbilane synthase [Saccharopolyspora antimicrobica]SEG90019.1 hydroxymethylbilane synthase [Saccharopolyspora kobensis]SFD88572.1 hydroxymethylbilane synthase [Saccharopolyspora kobensis]SFM39434.1 hydroxymethylbilane synthase [Saccharopolyspora antimicrobica]
MNKTLRIGTRGSALAVAQCSWVAEQLEQAGYPTQLITVKTPGDLSMAPIAEIGVGVFTSALREALATGEVDVAVHSFKDLPTEPDPRLSLAAVPVREDPRDALVARDGLTLGELPPGSVVGTGSPRRASQLRALGLGLEVRSIRGNVDTRLRKVTDGELDAVVLARAGLARVGRLEVITETLDPLQMLPAPAQGALAVECRVDDVDTEHLLQSVLDDQASRAAAAAERGMLNALEAGCSAPVGALAEVVEDLDEDGRVALRLSLRGVVAADDSRLVRASATGETTAADQLGRDLAAQLIEARTALLSGPGSS